LNPGLLFVLPGAPGKSAAVTARWVAAAELARAVGRRFGGADMLTPHGVLSPADVEEQAVRGAAANSLAGTAVRGLPRSARLLVEDIRSWGQARRLRAAGEPLARRPYRLVIQLHHRFHDCGLFVARAAGAPFVLRLEGLEVREEADWGLSRRWGSVVESIGEFRLIRGADLVASVSTALDNQLTTAGIESRRRFVLPNGVDLRRFCPGEPDPELRRTLGLEGRFVIGWVGGFRPFHGLEHVTDIARHFSSIVPEAILCLLGTGPLRDRIAGSLRGLEDIVRLLPPVSHRDIPRWIRTFDACLLLAGSGPFHYSPMKLYEYLACGRPVVAARVGEVPRIVSDGREGFLVGADEPAGVARAVQRLAADPELTARMGKNARRSAESSSWDARAESLVRALRTRGFLHEEETGELTSRAPTRSPSRTSR
jgi:glycosyltransferase involved in cell wall biosynthesis